MVNRDREERLNSLLAEAQQAFERLTEAVREGQDLDLEVAEPGRGFGEMHLARLDRGALPFEAIVSW